LRAWSELASDVLDAAGARIRAKEEQERQRAAGRRALYRLGAFVRHGRDGYRGVVVGRDPAPAVPGSSSARDGGERHQQQHRADGPTNQPSYLVLADRQDCAEMLGGDQPLRYVRHEDLEPCPEHGRRISVNLDPDNWLLSPAGDRYVPSDAIGFKHGEDSDEEAGRATEVCLTRAAEAINRWQYESRAAPSTPSEGGGEDGVLLSVRKLIGLLQIVDNSRDAESVQEAIKEARKAHPRLELRRRLETGLGELAAGDAEGAIRTYMSIADEDPISYPEVHNRLATCHFVAGRLDEAAVCARRALALDPGHAQAWSGLGLVHFERREHRRAMGCFRESIRIDPWSPVASKLSACVDMVNREAFQAAAVQLEDPGLDREDL
jgi:hemimethylated DNA binding protein